MNLNSFSNSCVCLCRYELQITGDGISNQQTNPEVTVDVNRPSSLLNEQMFALKTITSKLKNAYNGLDVEWIDIGELDYRKKSSIIPFTSPSSCCASSSSVLPHMILHMLSRSSVHVSIGSCDHVTTLFLK